MSTTSRVGQSSSGSSRVKAPKILQGLGDLGLGGKNCGRNRVVLLVTVEPSVQMAEAGIEAFCNLGSPMREEEPEARLEVP